jgi:hypothetical protein
VSACCVWIVVWGVVIECPPQSCLNAIVLAHQPLTPKCPLLPQTALRSIVLVDVYEVETSCGFVVPIMKFESHRPMYHTYVSRNSSPAETCGMPSCVHVCAHVLE